ncbi:hypothetical protein [Kitasatospora sp. NPDC004531]
MGVSRVAVNRRVVSAGWLRIGILGPLRLAGSATVLTGIALLELAH